MVNLRTGTIKTHSPDKPQYKIWLASNHQVNGDADDDALWRHLHIINFSQSNLDREDLNLKQHLRSPEVLCGVLYWAIQGAMKWYQADRLPQPEQMKQSLASHRLALDAVQMWLDEKAELVYAAWTSSSDITSSYTAWCKENNVEPKIGRGLAASLGIKAVCPEKNTITMAPRPEACWGFAFSSLHNKTQDRIRHLIPTFLILY